MNMTDDELRRAAKARVARLFHLDPGTLLPNLEFGVDLRASFRSDFKENEIDKIDFDLRDVAERKTSKDLGSGALVIRTVGDYCEYMVRAHRMKPKDVLHVLREELGSA